MEWVQSALGSLRSKFAPENPLKTPVQPSAGMKRMKERTSREHPMLPFARDTMNMVFPGVGNVFSPLTNRALHALDIQDEVAYEAGARTQDALDFLPSPLPEIAATGVYTAGNVFDPVPGPNLALIAGPAARTADNVALALAKKMKEAGASTDEIYSTTGWWLDHPDGVPRFEIDDSGSMPISQKSMSLGERADWDAGNSVLVRRQKALAHPKLSAAYPETKDIGVSLRRDLDGGAYDEDWRMIKVGAEDNGAANRSTMLHELQHDIQRQENMARGGSPRNFIEDVRRERDRFNELIQSLNERMSEVVKRKNAIAKRFDISVDEKKAQLDKLSNDYNALLDDRQEIVNKLQAIEGKYGGSEEEAFKRYKKLAGEVEARLVQDRMNMFMTERMENPFYKNFDVPLDEQTVRRETK